MDMLRILSNEDLTMSSLTEKELIKQQCPYHLTQYDICAKPLTDTLLCYPKEECKRK